MSSWIHLDGHVKTKATDKRAAEVLLAEAPTGSEGPARVSSLGQKFPGYWTIDGDLRNMDEEDVPAVRDWFIGVVEALTATEAELEVRGYQWLYFFQLVDGRVVLVPRRFEAATVQ